MKGGKTPIHRQPWYPADYHGDEHVKFLKRRRAYKILTFYRHFLDFSFLAGGDLPSDPRRLAAVLEMPTQDVREGLAFCLRVGLVVEAPCPRCGDELPTMRWQVGGDGGGDAVTSCPRCGCDTSDGRLYQKRVRRDVAREQEYRETQREHGKEGGRPPKKGTLSGDDSQTSPPTPPSTPPSPHLPAAAPAGDARPVAWSREACDAWITRFGGTAPGGQIGKALKPLVDRHGWSEVATAWRSYLAQTDAEYASPARFAATYGRWSGTAPPGTARESSAAVLRAAVMGGMKGK